MSVAIPEPSFTSQTLGVILGSILSAEVSREQERIATEARYQAALELSRQVARSMGIGASEAFDALTYIPDSQLYHLQSPQGWILLADFIAERLALPSPHFQPCIH